LKLKIGGGQLQSVKPEVQLSTELDSLSFLIDTSNFKEQTKKQEDVPMRRKVQQKEARSGYSRTDSVNSGSAPDYQIYTPLGWAPW
jgi:hypothetical protein